MRVVSWNVHGCVGADRRFDPDRTASAAAWSNGGCTPHGFGNATLSRGALAAEETYDLSVRGHEPRLCLVALLVEPPVRLANVHLGLLPGERRAQLGVLLDELGPLGPHPAVAPTVLAGDFNDFPRGAVSRALERVFVDAARAAAARPPRTFPSRRPLLRLDRLYVAGAVEVLACWVDASDAARAASDHLPVVAELRVGAHSLRDRRA
jgi:endonuclease/exonuclease/phosphatase family metal-dependent hydrolase